MTVTGALGIAVAQFAPTADTAANLDVIRQLTGAASDRGARLVVFPEYSSYFVDPFDASLVENAQPVDGEFVTQLARIAAEHDVHVVAGLLEVAGDERRVRNTVVAVHAGGLLAAYRKLHLYDAFGQRESDWVAPGEIGDPETFVAGGMGFGLQTCYDVRFPEVTRRIVDAGADVICMPAEWVRGPLKEAHWRTLTTARALENTAYVVAADHAPPGGAGNSMIVDPMGVELATVGEQEDVALAWVSTARIAAVRKLNPALALRRFAVTVRPEPPARG